jgi:hypothetical protein
MGALVSLLTPVPTEHRHYIHDVYLSAPAIEVTYDLMREMEKGNAWYPTQISLSIAAGHSTWEGLMMAMFDAYKIDRSKIEGMYWATWVTKHVPTFQAESGEAYTARSKIFNDLTNSKIIAGYLIDSEWDFYFKLETHPVSGMFANSPTPPLTNYLRPTEEGLNKPV